MSKEFVVNLDKYTLQFIQLPDGYDENIRGVYSLYNECGWYVRSSNYPYVYESKEIFLPGDRKYDDDRGCNIPKGCSYKNIEQVLQGFCRKYGYRYINMNESTVVL